MEMDRNVRNVDENMEDFAQLLASHEVSGASLHPGQKISGTIIEISRDNVFIDVGIKQDATLDRAEILDADGNETVAPGDVMEAWVVSVSPQGPRLSRSMTGSGAAALEEARDAGIPVEGRVLNSCKGGYQVEVLGKTAFCPGSQMQYRGEDGKNDPVGLSMRFLVTRVENHGRNIVVSHRALVERERRESIDKLLESIKIGDIVEGPVSRLTQFGAFIKLAPAVEGLAHISEISWSRIANPDEALSVGDQIRAKVISLEKDARDNLRIGLSPRQAMEDPWIGIEKRFAPGDNARGKVRRLAPYGAFIEIAPGIEGLAHISEFSWEKRILKPEDMLSPGDEVETRIKEIDPAARRISLSLRDAQGDPWSGAEERFHAGSIVSGIVESRGAHGIFIALEPGVVGLLPQGALHGGEAAQKYSKANIGDEVQIAVRSVDAAARRISLAPAGEEIGPADTSWRQHVKKAPQNGENMGIMAQALQKAFQNKH